MTEYSKWGAVQQVSKHARGIRFLSTASHGGFALSPGRVSEMIDKGLPGKRYYEEDCEAVLVYLGFPELFADKQEIAQSIAKNCFPDEYQAFTGQPVSVEDSRVLRERQFKADTKDRMVVISASNSGCPAGMVVCTAKRGDRCGQGESIDYLVPANEYKTRSSFGFIIDEAVHQKLN